MMWYIATKVSDGVRMAFPVGSTAVTYDTTKFQATIDQRMERVKDIGRVYMEALSHSAEDAEDAEKLKSLIQQELEDRGREYSRAGTVDALLVFAGTEVPVRDLVVKADVNEMLREVGKPEPEDLSGVDWSSLSDSPE